jgi:hypothetical protein
MDMARLKVTFVDGPSVFWTFGGLGQQPNPNTNHLCVFVEMVIQMHS